jgi:hypothetical protein
MGSKSKLKHQQYLSFGYGARVLMLNFASSLQRGKRMLLRKHRATMKRRHAFLDLQQATAHAARHAHSVELAKAIGGEINPAYRPANVELYLERYRSACEERERVFRQG